MSSNNMSSVEIPVKVLPRMMGLNNVAVKALFYFLWRMGSEGGVDGFGYLKVRYGDAVRVTGLPSRQQVYAGFRELCDMCILERGAIAGYYRIRQKSVGIGVREREGVS